MTKVRYGVSPWIDRVPKSRRVTFPKQRGHLEVDVAILGGGLIGCLTAHALSMAGASTAVLETAKIGEQQTGHQLGLALLEPQADFGTVARLYGLRRARRVWQIARRGAQDLASILKRCGVRCDLASEDLIEVALRPEDEKALARAHKARADADLDVGWLGATLLRKQTGGPGVGGARVRGNVVLDPHRACVGMARAAVTRGAVIFQDTEAVRVRTGRDGVEIRTRRGTVEAGRVVVATGHPSATFGALRRHVTAMESYAVMTQPLPAAVRKTMGRRGVVLRDSASPPHYLRWTKDARVIFAGADQAQPHPRSRERTLTQRTGQLMYELSTIYPAISGLQPDYGWSASYAMTKDGLPLIGPHRSYPRHLFALGIGRGGLGLAYAASRILVRHHLEEPTKDDEMFGFGRIRR